MADDQQIPAGWYQDPLNPEKFRWWDGAQWSEKVQFRPADGVADEVSGRAKRVDIAADGTAHKGRRVWGKMSGRTKFAVILVVVGVAYLAWKILGG